MTDTLEHYRQRIDIARAFAAQIQQQLEEEDWDKVESLLDQRNQAVAAAFVPDLPESIHDYARQAFNEIRAQDNTLMVRARELQSESGKELAALNRKQTSIDAYKLD